MAIAFVGAADLQASGATTSWTVSYTVGGGVDRLVVLGIATSGSGDDITGATWNGVTMALVSKVERTSTFWVYHFALVNPDSGTHDFIVSAGTADFIFGVAADYSGVKQTLNPEVSNTKTEAATSDFDVAVTTQTDGAWTILVAGGNGLTDMLAGTGTTRRAYTGSPQSDRLLGLFDSGAAVSPAGSSTLHCNYSDARDIGGIIASYAQAAEVPAGLLIQNALA